MKKRLKKRSKKLVLTRETLRHMQQPQAVSGAGPSLSCGDTCRYSIGECEGTCGGGTDNRSDCQVCSDLGGCSHGPGCNISQDIVTCV